MSTTDKSRAGLCPLLSIEAQLGALVTIGPSPGGEIRLVPILGGRFEGSDLAGVVLPGGSDWQSVRSDRGLDISARYLLSTDRDELIEVRSDGLRTAAPEVLERLGRGELVPPDQYYFRTAMRFRTAAPRLLRLNDLLAISYGERRAASVKLEIHEVL